jgi:DnaJ-class molecular chaperone
MRTEELTPEKIIRTGALQHDVNSESCWCRPELKQLCPECKGHSQRQKRCWKCLGEGLVDAYDDTLTSIIIHRDL